MSALEDTIKAYVTKVANDPTSVWTTSHPKETPKNLLEMIRAAKNKLVQSQRYDDAKDLRDIERLLMEKLGNEPVVLNDIEAILDDVRESKNSAARAEEGVGSIEQRIEKLEKALSEEMARTREMDGTIAGVVIDVARLKRYEYIDVPMPVTVGGDNVYQGTDPTDGVTKEDDIIRKDELLKWLDAEIAMAEENVEIANANASMGAGIKPTATMQAMQTMLATYKAVKAHIEG